VDRVEVQFCFKLPKKEQRKEPPEDGGGGGSGGAIGINPRRMEDGEQEATTQNKQDKGSKLNTEDTPKITQKTPGRRVEQEAPRLMVAIV